MATRSYSVVVDPARSSEEVDELARRLGPLTRQSADQLAELLERGAVTLETDLQRAEALRLFRQLERRSAPVEIRDGEGEVVESSVPGPETSGERSEDEGGGGSSRLESGGPVVGSDSGGTRGEGGDRESASASEPASEPETVLEFEPATSPAGVESSASASSGGSATISPEEGDGDSHRESALEIPEAGAPGASGDGPVGSSGGPEPFDPAGMGEALGGEEIGSAGGESNRFGQRPAHVPALAAALSAVAPGAGEAYNGDSERGWSYAIRALLVVPWVQSVRRALEGARRIREGEREKPPAGSLLRAVGHAALFWAGIVGVGFALWTASGSLDTRGEPSEPVREFEAPAPRARAVDRAIVEVQEGRLEAWDRAGKRQVEEDERYTLDRGERAVRLYRIGYEHCRAGEYGMCESVMRKVAKLESAYRRSAYRLQVWANVRRRDETPAAPMPEVAEPGARDAGTGEEIATPPDTATLSEGEVRDAGR